MTAIAASLWQLDVGPWERGRCAVGSTCPTPGVLVACRASLLRFAAGNAFIEYQLEPVFCVNASGAWPQRRHEEHRKADAVGLERSAVKKGRCDARYMFIHVALMYCMTRRICCLDGRGCCCVQQLRVVTADRGFWTPALIVLVSQVNPSLCLVHRLRGLVGLAVAVGVHAAIC
jgi:hypothetical protein